VEKAKETLLPLLIIIGGKKIQEGKSRLSSSYMLFGTMNNTALHLEHLPSKSCLLDI